ncbi:MAG: hypothetical protein ACD_76C00144G0003 [uncultured bacterium]|nr:MAG: hypothetical protein ACD_76C00144G0003 [uncultured bacterium]HBD05018.1 hypothetical protein [Candidatus Uhrbacteria bacterium]
MNFFRLFFRQKDPRYIVNKYNIPDTINWNIELNENGLIATSDNLPGLVTNAKNPEELLEMINDAVLEYFDVPKMDSDFVFESLNLQGRGTVLLRHVQGQRQYA